MSKVHQQIEIFQQTISRLFSLFVLIVYMFLLSRCEQWFLSFRGPERNHLLWGGNSDISKWVSSSFPHRAIPWTSAAQYWLPAAEGALLSTGTVHLHTFGECVSEMFFESYHLFIIVGFLPQDIVTRHLTEKSVAEDQASSLGPAMWATGSQSELTPSESLATSDNVRCFVLLKKTTLCFPLYHTNSFCVLFSGGIWEECDNKIRLCCEESSRQRKHDRQRKPALDLL